MIVGGAEAAAPPVSDRNGCLYVALSKEHRVSRTFRAAWFLTHLNQALDNLTDQENEKLQDIHILGNRGVAGGVVSPQTDVLYLCWQYSLVFVLDVSPNMRSVSNSNYLVKVDQAMDSLCKCLTLLTQPFVVDGSGETVKPRLCVTVFIFSGVSNEKPIHVLVQGQYVRHEDCQGFLETLNADVRSYGSTMAAECDGRHGTELSATGDTSMEVMLRAGSLAIQLLPRGALKGVILFTDGLSGFSSPASMHNTVTNMRGGNVSCWVVHIGGAGHPNSPLGLVPDLETLNFICRACNGCVICPEKLDADFTKAGRGMAEGVTENVRGPNILQEAVLMWSWQRSAFNARVRGVVGPEWEEFEDPFTPQKHQQFHSNAITAPLLGMVGCKIREGFYLDDLHVRDGIVEVRLCYPWKPCVYIYYTIQASWPLSLEPEELQFNTSYSGPYLFVHDVLSDHTSSGITPYRLGAVRKFKQALQRFSSSDALLAHFLAFSTCPSHYTLSHSVQDGLPLFYFPPNSPKPVPSPGINTSGGKSSSLHPYWRALCTVDTSQWFRWFHSNKIVLVLHPEFPLPRNLLTMFNGRYASPLCRPNASHLFDYLKGWSSMVLLEGHSYIRFLPYHAHPPRYFCVVRVAQKHPCVVLHVGHIEGTPHVLQRETANMLRAGLGQLCAVLGKTGTSKKTSISARGKPVLVVIRKQLQRFMVRHEPVGHTHIQPGGMSFSEPSERLAQMDYLTGYKCWWQVPLHSPEVAMALLRCRLREGFVITNTHYGMVTLVVQLRVKQETDDAHDDQGLPFLLQYVIFPYEHGEDHQTRAELWVEPQYGCIISCPSGLQYLCGLRHCDIASAIHEVDRAVVLETSSFVHLLSACESKVGEVCSEEHVEGGGSCSEGRGFSHTCKVPFQLDSLLHKSTVCALLLRAMSDDVVPSGGVVSLTQCSLLNSKFWASLYQHLLGVAPTRVPLVQCGGILRRLRASSKLQALFSLGGFESSVEEVEWVCCALSHDGHISVLCLPRGFYHRVSVPTEWQGSMSPVSSPSFSPCSSAPSTLRVGENSVPPRPLWLPLLLLQLDHTHFLESSTFAPSSSPPESLSSQDSCQVLDLIGLEVSGPDLVSEISGLHRTCFMDLLHTALNSQLTLSPEDFHVALENCQQSSVSLDITAFFSVLCPHSETTLHALPGLGSVSIPLTTEALCCLLGAALAKREWTASVNVRDNVEEEGECSQSGVELNQVFVKQLEQLGFQPVMGSPHGHYWLDTNSLDHVKQVSEQSYSVVPLSQSSSSDPSPLHEPISIPGPSKEPDEDISEEEADFGLTLLISPRSEEYEQKDNSQVGGARDTTADVTTPPLFLHVSLSLRDQHGCIVGQQTGLASHHGPFTSCLKSLLEMITMEESPEVSGNEEGGVAGYTVAVDLGFSYIQENVMEQGQSDIPRCYQGVVASLQQYVHWLLCDELVAMGRSLGDVSAALLQDVSAHVQNSHNLVSTCRLKMVPLKFVFGELHSITHFVHQLEALDFPGHTLHKIDDYYYLETNPPSVGSAHQSADLYLSEGDLHVSSHLSVSSGSNTHRSKTPPPPPPILLSARQHRRSQSTGYPMGHAPPPPPSSSQPSSEYSSRPELVEVGSGYEGGMSSGSSLSEVKEGGARSQVCVAMEGLTWIILRVLAKTVTIYFQVRNSRQLRSEVMEELYDIYEQVSVKVEWTCHNTNQWFLLKDMLDTHLCSPYLLLESGSEAWVEGHQHGRAEPFRALEFACDLVHSCHITPHWRVKEMKPKAALLVTRSALSAFAVTNRKDVYVLQDVTATGEESIFYVKVDESLCSVGKLDQLDFSPSLERRDTTGTVDATDTLSTMSYQQSLSEVQVDYDRRGGGGGAMPVSEVPGLSLLSLQGKPQESLVLQVYGICPASRDFQERLHGTIQRKLEATTLDILCGLYARNPQLKLAPEDVQFLQPDFRKPSLTFTLPLPEWLGDGYRQTLFFYFLQVLSTLAFYPHYSSSENKEHMQLQADLELDNTYLANDLNKEALPDHLFLYIRPQTKGRGMAVLCPSLVDTLGRGVNPLAGWTAPMKQLQENLVFSQDCVVSEQAVSGCYSIKLHVWEKGNIGIEEFMQRLSASYKQAMADFYLEICLLAMPMAMVEEVEPLDVPSVLVAMDAEEEEEEEEVEEEQECDIKTEQRTPHKKISVSSIDRMLMTSPLQRGSESSSRRGSEALPWRIAEAWRKSSEPPSRKVSETLGMKGTEAFARKMSESPSRRGSENPSRRGSENPSVFSSLTSSRRSSDAFWRNYDNCTMTPGDSSTHAESRRVSGSGGVLLERVSQVLSMWKQDQATGLISASVIDEVDESQYTSQTSLSTAGERGTPPRSSPIPSAMGGEPGKAKVGGGMAWLAKEKQRRTWKARQALLRDAELGRCGILTETYTDTLPQHLSKTQQLHSPSVKHVKLPLLGHYSALTAVSQVASSLQAIFPDFTVSSFHKIAYGYSHFTPEKDWTKVQRTSGTLLHAHFIIVARNFAQWEECLGGGHTPSTDSAMEGSTTQLFSSLGGKFSFSHPPSSNMARTPLRAAGSSKDFIPRRRMVWVRVTPSQVEAWLYNVNEQTVKRVVERVQVICDWLAGRAGLLHHLLAQKMGLFKHCQGHAVLHYTKMAEKKGSNMNGIVKIIKNNTPMEEPSPPTRLGFGATHLVPADHISINTIYQDQRPYGGVASSQDPVFNHGCQFRNWHTFRRKQLDAQDLLGRVFASWQARGGGGASIPVDADSIKSLKRMARLLHYCTASLLLCPPKVTPTSTTWLQEVEREVLCSYLKYLNTLGFQAINERVSVKRKAASPRPPSSSAPYRLLQHSWPTGIIMAEVMFVNADFTVKLYTLEQSRLQRGVEFSPAFSKECARYKDFIHVHSFMHDFHLRLLQDFLCGTRSPAYPLHLSQFVAQCHQHSSPPPHYVNNLLAKGKVCVPSAVEPHLLYRHLITQCKTFDATALLLELGRDQAASATYQDGEVGLLIDVNTSLSPDLTALATSIQHGYCVRVLALYTEHQVLSDHVRYLELVFYLLLVHKEELFPQLTSSSPHLAASCHPLPADTPNTEHESDLHVKVREHRKKMGYGSLSTDCASSKLVLEEEEVGRQLQCITTHLENIIRTGLHHMRKDELWKRMLYGTTTPPADTRSVVWSDLSFVDFQDLLYMVSECPLETLDQRLVHFKKQPRKWFKKLVSPLKMKFGENVREYTSDNQTYVVIINPDWQDMIVLVRADVDGHRHGLSAVYRKPKEGSSIPEQERLITSHVEADRQHIETVVNFCCSFMWATILDSAPPPPTLQFL